MVKVISAKLLLVEAITWSNWPKPPPQSSFLFKYFFVIIFFLLDFKNHTYVIWVNLPPNTQNDRTKLMLPHLKVRIGERMGET